jgi:hypothetical protein
MIALLRAPIRLALLCGLMLAACQSPNVWKTRSLADLAVGETVRVDYRHQGCFVSGVTQRVEVARSEEGWTFETWVPEEGGDSLRSLGMMWIKPADLVAWEELVASHRDADGMHLSTSSTSVDLAWRRGDRVLRVASWSRSMGADETEDWFAAPADPLTLQLQEAAARLGEGSPR